MERLLENFEIPAGYRVIQTGIDQTSGIVFEAAERALKHDERLYFSIIHEEEPHINLGRTQEWIPEVDRDLQFRRPGGGGYIVHPTYCIGEALPSNPKEDIESERDRLGKEVAGVLRPLFEEEVAYASSEGDIYLRGGGQLAGNGIADITFEEDEPVTGNATVVRSCMYPEIPETDIYPEEGIRSRIEPVKYIEDIRKELDNGFEEIRADEFVSDINRERGRILQEEDGYRNAWSCF